MTDAIAPSSLQAAGPGLSAAPWRWILVGVTAVAATAGLWIGSPQAAAEASAAAGPELTMMLRFMAMVKAATALAAVAIIGWRLGFAASPTLAAMYIAAAALMAAAPLPIWQIAQAGLGAGLFHAGVLLAVIALFADRDRAAVGGAAWSRLRGGRD